MLTFIAVGLVSAAAYAAESYDTKATLDWRAAYETQLRSADGWLTVAGLFFLKPGANSIGTGESSDIKLPVGVAPAQAGQLIYEDGKVFVELRPVVQGQINGTPISGRTELKPAAPEQKRPADKLTIGRLRLNVHKSGERLAIRLRDPESRLRTSFTGVKWFPIDPAWRLTGRFLPFPSSRTIPIQNILGDTADSTSPGEVEVKIAGVTTRLLALDDGDKLWFVFRDATSSGETYRIRFLYTDRPDAQRNVTLDFNRVENPPCAYNPYTTCPLPPPQNRLKVAIRAGEKAYHSEANETSDPSASRSER
jgi:uncharacterized protein